MTPFRERKVPPLVWCSLTCLCDRCLAEDERLCVITTNCFPADVVIGR